MKYTVYEGGKPAVMAPRTFKCWKNATFATKREAEVCAYLWCYAVTREQAENIAPEMEVGKKYDYGMWQVPVWMHIEVHD